MFLAVDVGNTHIVMGTFDDRVPEPSKALAGHWRISTDERRTADELALIVRQLLEPAGWSLGEIDAVAISSVVPRVTASLREMVEEYIHVDPLILQPGVKSGMPVLYDNPKEVGADRIANAVAAFEEYGGPCVVVDFGTATTFDAISRAGEYLGGAISPGVEVSAKALFDAAAGLRRVELRTPRNVIGRSTAESIQSGILYGVAGQVDSMVRRFKAELGEDAHVVATGGLAPLVVPNCETIRHHDEFLTLKGLLIVHRRNR